MFALGHRGNKWMQSHICAGSPELELGCTRTTPGLHHQCSSAQAAKHRCSFRSRLLVMLTGRDYSQWLVRPPAPPPLFSNDHWGLWFQGGWNSQPQVYYFPDIGTDDVEGHAQSRTATTRKSCRSMCSSLSASSSATPWTAAHQAPLSMARFRQECWSCLPFPSRLVEAYLLYI